ncbi:MAG: hypothetical protein D6746_11460 [Bacteroidetes bacterium]|nr:MAG: hypothetical protein D6746_11460 [Bacteroidota bacterium]
MTRKKKERDLDNTYDSIRITKRTAKRLSRIKEWLRDNKEELGISGRISYAVVLDFVMERYLEQKEKVKKLKAQIAKLKAEAAGEWTDD